MSITRDQYDCCILGAGSSGLLMAIVLVQEGHRVAIIDDIKEKKHAFYHATTKNYLSILDSIGILDKVLEKNIFIPARFFLKWSSEEVKEKQSPAFLLNKYVHDQSLYEIAKELDDLDIYKGRVAYEESIDKKWIFTLSNYQFKAKFLINSTGKSLSKLKSNTNNNIDLGRREQLAKTIATSFQWTHQVGESSAMIYSEASKNQWHWGWNNKKNAGIIIFTDKKSSIDELKWVIQKSSIINFSLTSLTSVSPPIYYNATPRCADESIGSNWINIGDAHIKYDPVSSQGLLNAITSVLQAKVIINTFLNYPEDKDLAIQFYSEQSVNRWKNHGSTLTEIYNEMYMYTPSCFWRERCQSTASPMSTSSDNFSPININENDQFQKNPKLTIVETPVIANNRIIREKAMSLPTQNQPIAFIKNYCICDLLNLFEIPVSIKNLVAKGMDAKEVVQMIQFLLMKDLIFKL